MKTHLIPLAGLTLAAALYTSPVTAQAPPRGAVTAAAATPPPPGHLSRTEVELSDDAFALARAGGGDAATTVRRIFAGGESPDRPLIISSSSLDEKSLEALDEDLNIMARVLDKSVDHGGDDRKGAMGIHLWALGQGGNRGARNLYLDGYGAVFILNVNMPLLAPPSKPQAAEEKKEATSSTWEEARNELYGRDDDHRDFKREKSAVPFDAERVDDLKKDLAEALKNATHIRGLKDNEHVTIVVQGTGSERLMRRRNIGKKGEVGEDVFAFAFPAPGAGPRSVMTLRAKKSDIDAFAKGKTELDDFRKKIAVAVYQTPGSNNAGVSEIRLRGQQ
jgi:hypothetical protein